MYIRYFKCDCGNYLSNDKDIFPVCECGKQMTHKELYSCKSTPEAVIKIVKDDVNITSDGDVQGFFCHELGLTGKQQDEYKARHPDAVFNNKGALYIRSPHHLKDVLHEKGMVTLTDSKEYNDQHREMLERGRDGEFDKK
jgi:hypothetical protein